MRLEHANLSGHDAEAMTRFLDHDAGLPSSQRGPGYPWPFLVFMR